MSDTIMIVDDEHEIADLIEVYLKNENFEVFKFYSPTDALACLSNLKPDLAVLDVMMLCVAVGRHNQHLMALGDEPVPKCFDVSDDSVDVGQICLAKQGDSHGENLLKKFL